MGAPEILFASVTKLVKHHGSLRAASRDLNISVAYLSQIRSGKKPPGVRALKLLGLRKVIDYVRSDDEETQKTQ